MPEPITGAIIAKAIEASGSENASTASNLIQRMLGPGADAFGQALARSIDYRARNWGRIASKAAKKANADLELGIVNPRVAYVMLEDGSLCDDELMAEYLGGVLAASRTPDGRDDRAVTWSRVITGLSAFQVRAHYLLYREWAARLNGREDLDFMKMKTGEFVMRLESMEFMTRLAPEASGDDATIMNHAIIGLENAGLIGSDYGFSNKPVASNLLKRPMRVNPSYLGIELYGWALGLPDLHPSEFPSRAQVFDIDDPIPRLKGVLLPKLPGGEDATESADA